MRKILPLQEKSKLNGNNSSKGIILMKKEWEDKKHFGTRLNTRDPSRKI